MDAVALSSVIEDCEAACRDACYSPGLVVPSMLAALCAADISRDPHYDALAELAGDWYFGRNSFGALLVTNGGCRDGIDDHGISTNMGAESTLAYLSSAIALAEPRAERLRIAR